MKRMFYHCLQTYHSLLHMVMKRKLILLFFGIICSSLTITAQVSHKFEPDPHVGKYLSPWFKMKPNAVYFSIWDVALNKSIGLGYQRKLTNRLWAEGGLQIGTGLQWVSGEISSILGNSLFAVPSSFKGYGDKMVLEESDSIGAKSNIHLSIYRNMYGSPVVNALAYGLELNIGKYNYNYSTYLINTSVHKESTLRVINPMISWAYKTPLYGPVGFDFTMHAGPAFVSFPKENDSQSVVSGLHYTKLVYSLQLKLFVAF